jgi:hypothetical protein
MRQFQRKRRKAAQSPSCKQKEPPRRVYTMPRSFGVAQRNDHTPQCTPMESVHMPPLQIDPLIALAVVLATGATDAIYVMFTNSVLKRRRLPAATWSSIWYLLSSFAVIKYTNDWTYVFFAAFGSFVGAYLTLTFLRPAASHQPVGASPCADRE